MSLGVALAAAVTAAAVVSVSPAAATLLKTFNGTVNASGTQYSVNFVTVQGVGNMHADLTWTGTATLAMYLKDPTGTQVLFVPGVSTPPSSFDFDAQTLGKKVAPGRTERKGEKDCSRVKNLRLVETIT